MWYRLTREPEYLRAEMFDRRTAEETRLFLAAAAAELERDPCSAVLVWVRSSIPVFAVGRYGLEDYLDRLAGRSAFKIALLADSEEVRISHEYVEALARQRGVAVRAFRDEAAALQWLGAAPGSG